MEPICLKIQTANPAAWRNLLSAEREFILKESDHQWAIPILFVLPPPAVLLKSECFLGIEQVYFLLVVDPNGVHGMELIFWTQHSW